MYFLLIIKKSGSFFSLFRDTVPSLSLLAPHPQRRSLLKPYDMDSGEGAGGGTGMWRVEWVLTLCLRSRHTALIYSVFMGI